MATNKEAVKHLERLQVSNASYIVARLVEGGYIEETPLSEPERIAQAARDWIGKVSEEQAYQFASGWSTDSWETVLDERDIAHNIPKLRNIFLATVILAKEAGVEL